MIIVAVGTLISCKSTFNASEAMDVPDNRNAVYQEIISNPNQFNEFIDLAQQDEGARKLMMHKMMQERLDRNPEMKKKMKEKMMKDPAMKEAMMEEMHSKMKSNPEMAEKMMDKMIQFLHENPELMEKMKAKMKAHQEKM